MLRKNGKIKAEYKHICGKVTEELKPMVNYLIDQKLTDEEIIGTLTSAVVLLVSQEHTRRRMGKVELDNTKKSTT